MDRVIRSDGKYTHYPVPSEIKASKELERSQRTSGVGMVLYSQGHEQKHWQSGSI
jgi:hypothetical protein